MDRWAEWRLETLSGGLTFQQFLEVLRTGYDHGQAHVSAVARIDGTVLQVMPWPNLQNMTDGDINAIYEYLSSVPCIAKYSGKQLQPTLGERLPIGL